MHRVKVYHNDHRSNTTQHNKQQTSIKRLEQRASVAQAEGAGDSWQAFSPSQRLMELFLSAAYFHSRQKQSSKNEIMKFADQNILLNPEIRTSKPGTAIDQSTQVMVMINPVYSLLFRPA
jgi:hypothetical protein